MLVAGLTDSGVKNQVLQFFYNSADGDLALVSSYEAADILFCESLDIYEAISDYGAQAFALHSPSASLPLITCSSPQRTLHLPEHLLLHLGLILPLMVFCSWLQHISFLSVPHILKNIFSLIS